MPRIVDRTGVRYGRLTAIKRVDGRKWLCRCDCGSEKVVDGRNLTSGNTKTCGCVVNYAVSHGLSGHHSYHRHAGMMRRCYDSRHRQYCDYGGRGIEVHAGWHDVVAFCKWIDENLGDPPDGHTLDRIDNNKSYAPGNVKWSDRREQYLNSRSVV